MGFFSTLSSIAANNKQFKKWEQNDADKQAQRKALANSKQFSDAELAKAEAKGKVIMNAIDVMDTHSEEVAENVETVVMPVVQLATPMATIATSAVGGKFILVPALEATEKASQGFFKSDNGLKLKELAEELIKKQKELGDFDPVSSIGLYNADYATSKLLRLSKKQKNILANSADDGVKNIYAQIAEITKKHKELPAVKNLPKKLALFAGLVAGVSAVVFVASNLIGAKLQVKSSRIARWQSREDMKDPKYFVQWNEEQIQEAEKNLEIKKQKEKNKGFFAKLKDARKENKSFIRVLKETISDNKKYEKWAENYNLEDKKVQGKLTEEQIKLAEKDQEVIQRITKQINNKAEDYSENMEVAAGVLIGGTPFLGFGVSSLLNLLVEKTGLGQKISDKVFKSTIKGLDATKAEKLKKLYEKTKPIIKDGKKIKPKAIENLDFLQTMWSSLDEATKTSSSTIGNLINKVKNTVKIASSTSFTRTKAIAAVGTLVTGIVGALIGLKLQKASARAGRFKAKQEIQNDITNFVGYTKEEFETVKDVKAEKKTVGQKFKEYVTFLPRVIKDYNEYQKYRKQDAGKQKELLDELVKLDASEEQLKEAETMQRKVFTTFESVDDKSQEYSESMEAANEMIQPILPFVGIGMALLPAIVGGAFMLKKGIPHTVEKITGFLGSKTKFLKGKIVSNYADDVARNITKSVGNAESKKLITPEMADKLRAGVKEVFEGQGELIAQHPEISTILDGIDFTKMSTNEINDFVVDLIKKFCPDSGLIQNIKSLLTKFGLADKTADMIKASFQNGTWRKTLMEYSKNLPNGLSGITRGLATSSMTDKQALQIFENLQKITQNIPKEKLDEILDVALKEFKKDPEKFMGILNSKGLREIFVTKKLKIGMGVTAGTWGALNMLLTYALESTFASMQKKAGRLGVMKGLEELEEVEYYA